MVVGQFLKETAGSGEPLPHGIVRVIADDNTIMEGQYVSGQSLGYCRAFHSDGSHHIGMVDGNLREGYGRTVTPKGTVKEGLWVQGALKNQT